jgi:heme exporter protein D
MSEFQEYLHMGGYALYVWGSYGLALVVLMLNAVLPRLRERRLLDALARRVRSRGMAP